MYLGGGATPRTVRLWPDPGDGQAAPTGEGARTHALARVRRLHTAYLPGLSCTPARLRPALASPFPDPAREAERHLALGWLAWLDGDPAAARPLLDQAAALAAALPAGEPAPAPTPAAPPPPDRLTLLGRSGYWAARVGLLLGDVSALASYETLLRGLGGSPQATAWFVDLLARAGRTERAEQVWRSVRGNRKVAGCDEGPLLEARSLLRRDDHAAAERALQEAAPAGCVAWAERWLLLAWARAGLRRFDRAREALRAARDGVYPAAALARWTALLEGRAAGAPAPFAGPGPVAWADFLRGQELRRAGQFEEAASAYEAARTTPAAPFARFGLVTLGRDDPAALLAANPGLFLALRCRARTTAARFLRREATPAELLGAEDAVAPPGDNPAASHLRAVATLLALRRPTPAELRALTWPDDRPHRRDLFRAGLEQAERLPPADRAAVLLAWAELPWLADEPSLTDDLGRALLCLSLETGNAELTRSLTDRAAGQPLVALLRAVESGEPVPDDMAARPAGRLWALARGLGAEQGAGPAAGLAELEAPGPWRGLARALQAWEAARSGDLDRLAGLLDPPDAWRSFEAGPPAFVTAGLVAALGRRPSHPVWRRPLLRWLGVWGAERAGEGAGPLLAAAGLPGGEGAVPPGVEPAAWWLHQAARAIGHDDQLALKLAQRAGAATPELERRAAAARLADTLRGPLGAWAPGPALLADLADQLAAWPGGIGVLAEPSPAALDALLDRPDLPARLAHHLALLARRAALAHEAAGRDAEAVAAWGRSWVGWLRLLADPGAVTDLGRGALLDHLLAALRARVQGLLAAGRIDEARASFGLARDLPALARAWLPPGSPACEDVERRAATFRDDLATDHLLAMREVLRHAEPPDALRADYARGLAHLARLLSLDHESPRLLTALVEVAGDWLLDLYRASDAPGLHAVLERYTPLALHLARLIEAQPAELTARAALAEFTKFRGFVEPDRVRKAELYREALRFDPANGNVRELLADLTEPAGPEGES